MQSLEALPLQLKQLKLSRLADLWQSKEQEAIQQQWRYPEYLRCLCDEELASRYQKRIARYTKESKLPSGKTLSSFDFDRVSVNVAQVAALGDDPSWIQSASNVVIFGPSGVGKTHLAAALGHRMIEQGIRVLFSSTTKLIQQLEAAKKSLRLPEMLNRLSRIPLLILDDIGYAKKTEHETSVLFELIAHRYENSSLLITANQPFSEWGSIFPDEMMTVAAIDRVVHHAHILKVSGPSFRRVEAESRSETESQA